MTMVSDESMVVDTPLSAKSLDTSGRSLARFPKP